MAKEKQVFFCKECGYESAKWLGQCPGCQSWNTFVEEKIKVGAHKTSVKKDVVAPTSILKATTADESRIKTEIKELDRVLGGGIVNNKVLENCNIDSSKYSGLAFGIGIERIAMLKYGINHMGKLFENDIEFLKQFKA